VKNEDEIDGSDKSQLNFFIRDLSIKLHKINRAFEVLGFRKPKKPMFSKKSIL